MEEKTMLTAEEFINKYGRHMQLDTKISMADMRSRQNKMPELELSTDEVSYQSDEPFTIHIGLGCFEMEFADKTKRCNDEDEQLAYTLYLKGHEEQHARSTTKRGWEHIVGDPNEYGEAAKTIIREMSAILEPQPRRFMKSSDYDYFIETVCPSYNVGITKAVLGKMSHWLVNAIEDGRIERLRCRLRPGYKSLMQWARGEIWLHEGIFEYVDMDSRQELLFVMNNILSLATTGHYTRNFVNFYGETDMEKKITAMIPEIRAAVKSDSFKAMIPHALEVCKKIAPFIIKAFETQQQQQGGQGNDQSDDQNSNQNNGQGNGQSNNQSNSQSNSQNNDSGNNSQQSQNGQNDGQSNGSNGQQSQQNGQDSDQKDSQDSAQNDDQNASSSDKNGQQQNDPSNGSNEQQNGQNGKQSNDQNNGQDNGSNNNSQQSQNGQNNSQDDGSNGPQPQQNGRSGQNSTQSNAQNNNGSNNNGQSNNQSNNSYGQQSQQNSSFGGKQSNGNHGMSTEQLEETIEQMLKDNNMTGNHAHTCDKGEETGDGVDSQSDGFDIFSSGDDSGNDTSDNGSGPQGNEESSETEKSGSDDGEGECSSQNGQLKTNPFATGGEQGSRGQYVSEDAEDLSEIVKKIMEQAASQIREMTSNEREAGQKRGQKVQETVDTSSCPDVSDICTAFDEMQRHYKLDQELPIDVQMRGTVLHNKFRRFFESKMIPSVRERRSGRLDAAGIYKLAMKQIDVFKRNAQHGQFDGCIEIMIDCSGSMCGYKMQMACQAAAIIEEGLKGLVPVKIIAFSSMSRITHQVIKNWEDSAAKNHCWNYFRHGVVKGGTPTAQSLLICQRDIEVRPEEKKLIILLTDENARCAGNHLPSVIKSVRKAGINLIGIYFEGQITHEDENSFADLFDHRDNICCSPEQIENDLLRLVRRFVKE